MGKILWTDPVRSKEVLQRGKEERNVLQPIKGWKIDWIDHMLPRICLLKHCMEGKI